jgi:hypothetical protein
MMLAPAEIAKQETITISEVVVEISGAHLIGFPPLMNGSSLMCIA